MRLYYSFGWINQNIFTHKAFYTYLCLIDDPYSFSHFIGEVYITKESRFLLDSSQWFPWNCITAGAS